MYAARKLLDSLHCALAGLWIAWAAAAGVHGQTANSVSGHAVAASAATPFGTLASTPLATLVTTGGMSNGDNAGVDVLGVLKTQALNAITTGVVGENASSAQSMATASDISILNGVITARDVVAVATSASNGLKATSSGAGSTIVDLVVRGVPMGVLSPQPNTTIEVPTVGTIVLNEQVVSGGGVTDRGIDLTMIHVILRNAVTGVKIGDIAIGNASSYAKFVR